MRIKGTNTITYTDVLVGEVWICSGQSNMAVPLTIATHAEQEIAAANYPRIRLFATQYATQQAPMDNVLGVWTPCTPAQARNFSAVGYFFARKLYRELGVPVGIISSAVGGTAAEAWTDRPGLESDPKLHGIVERLDKELPKYPPALNDTGWEGPNADDAAWREMTLPGGWEKAGVGLDTLDGTVWFRRTVTIPADWAGKALTLRFGPIDDGDTAYFNGVQVGAMDRLTPMNWKTPRCYTVPAALVKPGRAVLAVRVTDVMGEGGIVGTPEEMSLAPAADPAAAIPLAGAWKWRVCAWWPPNNMPTSLYNGMIAPWVGVAMRGAIWYQGESDAGNPAQYRALLPALIRGWRAARGDGAFPFLIVQLPNYMAQQPEPGESNWAELREAQFLTTMMAPQTDVAVTIDLGEAQNIHPANKQDVGERLGLLALVDVYGQKIAFTGPRYQSMTVEGDAIRLRFTQTNGGLISKGGAPLQGFAIAGADRKFVWATATIDGDSVLVRSAAVPHPVAVRYAWADNPRCTLYNGAGLPALPFRTDPPAK